jgi:hypothetical protein
MNSVLNVDLYYDKEMWYSFTYSFITMFMERKLTQNKKLSLSHDILFHCACNLCSSCRIRDHALVT